MRESSQPWRIEQGSKILPFLWLGFWTSLLMLPTLTLFRFWTRTFFRRRLWSETRINDEPLEYTGKGWELLAGYLMVFGFLWHAVVLVVFWLLVVVVIAVLLAALVGGGWVVNGAIEDLFQDPAWTAMLSSVVLIVALLIYSFVLVLVYAAMNAAIFLVRRYRFSRTSWRGIRLRQGGSALGYAMAAIGYGLLTVITFGWYGPAAQLRLERRLWNQATFGDRPFRWEEAPEGKKEPVYQSFAVFWIGGVLLYFGMIATLFCLGLMDTSAVSDPARVVKLYGVTIGFGILIALAGAWHFAVMIRRVTRSIRIDGVEMHSRFSTWNLIGLLLTNLLLVVFTLGFGALAAQMRGWRAIAQTLDVEGELDVATIGQTERGPRSGEGLADAFDLSGGI